MYNILIVDDDFRDCRGISNAVKKFGIPLSTHTAECGDDALEILKAKKIDILMTDIKMPDMSGIELAEAAKQLNPELVIIIMSAYKDFNYAQQAIGFGAVKYLLKPYPIDELTDTLKKAIEICDRKSESRKSAHSVSLHAKGDMLLDYLSGKTAFSEEIAAAFNTEQLQLVLIRVLQSYAPTEFPLVKLRELFASEPFVITLDGPEYILINSSTVNSDREFYTLVKDLFLNRFHLQICITYSPFTDISLLPEKYKSVRRAGEYFFFADKGLVLYTEDISDADGDTDSIDDLMDKIYFLIDTGNYSDFITALSHLFKALGQNAHFSSLYAKCISSSIINRLCNHRKIKASSRSLWIKFFHRIRRMKL